MCKVHMAMGHFDECQEATCEPWAKCAKRNQESKLLCLEGYVSQIFTGLQWPHPSWPMASVPRCNWQKAPSLVIPTLLDMCLFPLSSPLLQYFAGNIPIMSGLPFPLLNLILGYDKFPITMVWEIKISFYLTYSWKTVYFVWKTLYSLSCLEFHIGWYDYILHGFLFVGIYLGHLYQTFTVTLSFCLSIL